MDAESDAVGAKGGGTKTLMQGIASAYTYCERHLLVKVFGVNLVDDDDGNAAGGIGINIEPLTHDQALDLNERMDECLDNTQRAKLLEVLGVAQIEKLASSQYTLARNMMESKRKQV